MNGKGATPSDEPAAPPAAAGPKVAPPTTRPEEVEVKPTLTGKPDQAAYHAEQEIIKGEIDAVQGKLVWHLSLYTLGEYSPVLAAVCAEGQDILDIQKWSW